MRAKRLQLAKLDADSSSLDVLPLANMGDTPSWVGFKLNGVKISSVRFNITGECALFRACRNPRMQVMNTFTQYDPRKFTFTTTVSF